MRHASQANYEFAQRALKQEAGQQIDAGAVQGAARRIFQQVGERLVVVIGASGFEALLTRSLKLATAQFPCLSEIRLDRERGLEGLDMALASLSESEATAALASVFALFLDLLATFIGDDLASHLVSEVLPHVETDREET